MKKIRGALLICSMLMMTGCWDNTEINQRSVMLDLAVDKNIKMDETKPPNKRQRYTMTYSIPDMAKMTGTESLTEDVRTLITVNSPTMDMSINEIESRMQKTVTFSHIKGILLGEDLLKDRELFKEFLDASTREMMFGRSVPILATKGRAEKAIAVENPQQPVVGLFIMNYFNNKERPRGFFKEELLGNFILEMEDTGAATMPVFNTNEEGEIQISGGALLKDYELVAWLNQDEVRGQLFVEGKVKNAPVVAEYDDEYITYMVKRQRSKIAYKEDQGVWTCYINLVIEGDVREYLSDTNKKIFEQKAVDGIRDQIAKEITREVQEVVDRSKELKVDFLHIGSNMYHHYPKRWEYYKTDWEENYPKIPIQIHCDVKIRNTGALE